MKKLLCTCMSILFILSFFLIPNNKITPIYTISAITENSNTLWNTDDVDISHIDRNKKLICFSFDDSPDSTIRKITNVFTLFNKENLSCKASATFFINGIRIDNDSILQLKKAVKLGFELGNHTYNHKNLTKLPDELIKKEIELTDRELYDIDGKNYHLLRTPYGEVNEKIKNISNAPLIDWCIDTEDWTGKDSDKIYQMVMSEKFNGAIVLMHDGYKNTVEAVKKLLPSLRDAGYQVVNISQMSKFFNYPLYSKKLYTNMNLKNKTA